MENHFNNGYIHLCLVIIIHFVTVSMIKAKYYDGNNTPLLFPRNPNTLHRFRFSIDTQNSELLS